MIQIVFVVDPKRDNWVSIKKKKFVIGLGLNLTMMQPKEFKFRPILREI